MRSFVKQGKYRIATAAAFGGDLVSLIYFEIIYCGIFNRFSQHQQHVELPSSLIIVGMSGIHFAMNCPHVAEV